MSLTARIARLLASHRMAAVARLVAQPQRHQTALLRHLLHRARHTAFGRDHDFAQLLRLPADQLPAAYAAAVPMRDYEAFRPYVDRAVAGERHVLWPGRPSYLAKTSGTTSGTKYIPLTRESMRGQVRGAKDALLAYIRRTGRADFLDGKLIFLSGSPALERNAAGIRVGRLSGISQHFVPAYLQRNRVPSYATNVIEDWEAKVAAIVAETRDADLRLVSGIPPWVRMFFEAAEAATGRKPADLWPNLRLYVEGGVDYAPYHNAITQAFSGGTRQLDVVEVYPASEGFVAVQDGAYGQGLLLMLDYGVYFEFVPLAEYGKPGARRLAAWQVEAGQVYAILLSTNAGLWAYDIGDTVRVVSTQPLRIVVAGRVKHFLSAFGEHVIEEEVNAAMQGAAAATGAQVAEFTVAPYLGQQQGDSYHEWFVEFLQPPADTAALAEALDANLRQRNAYYADLRAAGMLQPAVLRALPPGATNRYMATLGKLGGQNKFPRLKNDRSVADALAAELQR